MKPISRHADPLESLEPLQKFIALMFWIPALTAVVFLRYRLGFRMIRPLYFIPAFAMMIALAGAGALITYGMSNIPNSLLPNGAAVAGARTAQQAAAEQGANRAGEISPNAGQISTPESDPPAYQQVPTGYRFKRNPDGTWARNPQRPDQFIAELIPSQPTIIPPEGGVQAAGIDASELPGEPSLLSRIPPLVLLAFPMVGLAIYHRRQGWQLIFSDQWHSMSGGLSHLARVLPFFTEPTIQRRIEPLLLGFFGIVAGLLGSSLLLSFWLVFAGVTLAGAEQLIYEREINDLLDRHDARVEARYANELDAVVKNGGRVPDQTTVATTGGVLVTVAPELEELLRSEQDDNRALSENLIAAL